MPRTEPGAWLKWLHVKGSSLPPPLSLGSPGKDFHISQILRTMFVIVWLLNMGYQIVDIMLIGFNTEAQAQKESSGRWLQA